MQIDGIGGTAKGFYKPEKIKAQDEPQPQPIATAEEVTTEESTEQPELKGVLKLLAEGHFKGVADLRLRIVHADKLDGVELPELSQPTGNGKAYEKFLAIYNEMNAPEPVEEIAEELIEDEAEEIVEVPTAEQTIEPETVSFMIDPLITGQHEEEPASIFDVPTLPILEEPVDILI